jgi:hypothetical protein
MPKGNTLSRLLIVTLTAAAVAAPAAVAMPTDPTGPSDAAQTSAEPSVAQDVRGEATVDTTAGPNNGRDLRTEGAKDPARAPLPGPPTWPANPQVIAPPNEPVPADGGDGGGIDAPVMALIIAGVLALGGGLTVAALRHRTRIAH